ncbi:hypothetical protein [Arthrobacter sp. NPDC057013]|uniref:hypothetical protein n=1 Tax=Arthrobacter sp. NPDC057013 TaxID=3345999 RepID=UPI0036363793
MIENLVTRTAPQLLDAYGIGPDTAAEILIVAGDNPERIHSRQPSPNSLASARSPPAPA